jgi:hypothetical protein
VQLSGPTWRLSSEMALAVATGAAMGAEPSAVALLVPVRRNSARVAELFLRSRCSAGHLRSDRSWRAIDHQG